MNKESRNTSFQTRLLLFTAILPIASMIAAIVAVLFFAYELPARVTIWSDFGGQIANLFTWQQVVIGFALWTLLTSGLATWLGVRHGHTSGTSKSAAFFGIWMGTFLPWLPTWMMHAQRGVVVGTEVPGANWILLVTVLVATVLAATAAALTPNPGKTRRD